MAFASGASAARTGRLRPDARATANTAPVSLVMRSPFLVKISGSIWRSALAIGTECLFPRLPRQRHENADHVLDLLQVVLARVYHHDRPGQAHELPVGSG